MIFQSIAGIYSAQEMGFRHKILDEIYKLDFDSVLELGCDGKDLPNLEILRDRYPDLKLAGCDNILFAHGVEKAEMLNVNLRAIDLNDGLPYPDKSYDLVFTSAVLMYVKDLHRVLKDLPRVAKKYIVLGEVMDRDYTKLIEADWTTIDIDKNFWPGYTHKYEGKILIGKL